jgi:hypothetical protein
MQKYTLQKNPLKETNNPLRSYYNSITNLNFPTQAKISSFSTKSSYKNRPIIIIIIIIYYLGAKIP